KVRHRQGPIAPRTTWSTRAASMRADWSPSMAVVRQTCWFSSGSYLPEPPRRRLTPEACRLVRHARLRIAGEAERAERAAVGWTNNPVHSRRSKDANLREAGDVLSSWRHRPLLFSNLSSFAAVVARRDVIEVAGYKCGKLY